jgi:acetyl esterase/lipase
MRTLRFLLSLTLLFTFALAAHAQLSETEKAAILIGQDFVARPDITYKIANNYPVKLDVYYPRHANGPVPVVMAIHGGGWVVGTKEDSVLYALPFLQMGFAVVNVEYRLAQVSLAPAAVEDCLCALHWIGRHADEYGFDLNKVIVTGGSAGGHLALTTAMIPPSAGFENECAYEDDKGWSGTFVDNRPKVAAVINWFGISDVAAMLQGSPDARGYAISWLGSLPNREALAKQLSPITYVRPGLPPILTIHGDADKLVPHQQSVELHRLLTKAGVQNKLVTVHGAGHGTFTEEQQLASWEAVKEFLASVGIHPVR